MAFHVLQNGAFGAGLEFGDGGYLDGECAAEAALPRSF